MSNDESTEVEPFTTGYEIFIGALSVLSLVNIVLLAVLRDQALQTVVYTVDIVLSLAFLIDFTVRLLRSPARLHYFFRDFGWADLLASLPFPQAKVLRIFRLIRVVRLLRHYGAAVSPGVSSRTGREVPCGPCCSSACWSWSSAAWRCCTWRRTRPEQTSRRPPMPSGTRS
jgi:hypothetical protein